MPVIRAHARTARAALAFQPNFIAGRIAVGTSLCTGEHVSWYTGVVTSGPSSARAA